MIDRCAECIGEVRQRCDTFYREVAVVIVDARKKLADGVAANDADAQDAANAEITRAVRLFSTAADRVLCKLDDIDQTGRLLETADSIYKPTPPPGSQN